MQSEYIGTEILSGKNIRKTIFLLVICQILSPRLNIIFENHATFVCICIKIFKKRHEIRNLNPRNIFIKLSVEKLIGRKGLGYGLIDWLHDSHLFDWLIDRLVHCLMDWLTDSVTFFTPKILPVGVRPVWDSKLKTNLDGLGVGIASKSNCCKFAGLTGRLCGRAAIAAPPPWRFLAVPKVDSAPPEDAGEDATKVETGAGAPAVEFCTEEGKFTPIAGGGGGMMTLGFSWSSSTFMVLLTPGGAVLLLRGGEAWWWVMMTAGVAGIFFWQPARCASRICWISVISRW